MSLLPVALSFTLLACAINFSAGSLKMYYLNRKIYKYELNGIVWKINHRLCSMS